jgi:uncharacterized protein YjbI with pentapeptide repeats
MNMRHATLILAGVAALSMSTSSRADDEGYRFNLVSGRCENSAGQQGRNPGFVGECGDLRDADLEGADLAHANLRGADLRRAYLFGADLRGTDLRDAELYRANLCHAVLAGADLRGAQLRGAYLFKTDLRSADLRGAHLNQALQGADLQRTSLAGAKFDAQTELPFCPIEAGRRLMVFDGSDTLVSQK